MLLPLLLPLENHEAWQRHAHDIAATSTEAGSEQAHKLTHAIAAASTEAGSEQPHKLDHAIAAVSTEAIPEQPHKPAHAVAATSTEAGSEQAHKLAHAALLSRICWGAWLARLGLRLQLPLLLLRGHVGLLLVGLLRMWASCCCCIGLRLLLMWRLGLLRVPILWWVACIGVTTVRHHG